MKHLLRLALGCVCFWPQTIQAFDSKAHDIIEAQAYLSILRGQSKYLKPPYCPLALSGTAVIDSLIAWRAMDAPKEVKRYQWQVLGNLPEVRSGDMDFVLNRQFSDNGQAFHFMATRGDLVREKAVDPVLKAPPYLLLGALDRCRNTLTAVFEELVSNCTQSKRIVRNSQLVSDNFYALIHSLVDSYSRAHVQRTADTKHIQYLKPWTLITGRIGKTYAPYQHHFPDEFDGEFLLGGLPEPGVEDTQDGHKNGKKNRQLGPLLDKNKKWYSPGAFRRDAGKRQIIDCTNSNNLNPYQYSCECLSPLGKAAQDAVEEFVVTTYLVLQARKAKQDPAVVSPEMNWAKFQERHFSADPAIDLKSPALARYEGALAPNTKVYQERRPGVQIAVAGSYPLGFGLGASVDLLQFRAFSLGPVLGIRRLSGQPGVEIDYGVGFRVPVSEGLSFRVNPFVVRTDLGDPQRLPIAEVSYQLEYYPNIRRQNGQPVGPALPSFFRLELPRFVYSEGYHRKYLSLGIGWDFGQATGVPVYAQSMRQRMQTWQQRPQRPVPTAQAIATARLGRTTTKIWWIFQGAYGARGTAGNFSPFLGGELTWDRNGAGERTGMGYGLMGKVAWQNISRAYHNKAFPVFQVGPTVRVTALGAHLLLEPLTYTRALSTETPTQDIPRIYRREDVQGTLGLALPLGNAEFLIELMRYSYADHILLQRRWMPAGFRLGYAF